MPRRPRKLPDHLFKPGQSGNPAGRRIGTTNEINNEIRQAFAILLSDQLPKLQEWLEAGAKKDPLKAADIMLRVSERFLPSLSKTLISDANGEAFTPITINLPNIPQINLGEPSASTLLTSPAEEVKTLREGTPAEIPLFLPELLDSQPLREGSPAEDQGDSREVPPDKL